MNVEVTSTGRGAGPAVAAECRGRVVPTDRPYRSTLDASGVLHVHGTVDELSARAFLDDVLGLLRVARGTTVVDLRDADFFSCAAAGALVAGWAGAGSERRRLEVVVGEGTVAQRVLAVSGLPHRLA